MRLIIIDGPWKLFTEDGVMRKQDRAACALMAVFPTPESFTRFAGNSENQAPLQSFIAFAVRNGIIDRPNEAALEAYIAGNARGADACRVRRPDSARRKQARHAN